MHTTAALITHSSTQFSSAVFWLGISSSCIEETTRVYIGIQMAYQCVKLIQLFNVFSIADKLIRTDNRFLWYPTQSIGIELDWSTLNISAECRRLAYGQTDKNWTTQVQLWTPQIASEECQGESSDPVSVAARKSRITNAQSRLASTAWAALFMTVAVTVLLWSSVPLHKTGKNERKHCV